MEVKKIKKVVLRHMGRKYPKITFTFNDESTKSITVRSDVETAQILLLGVKREIALGTFNLDDFLHKRSRAGITLGEFRDRFFEHRQKLVHIGHLKKSTYEHDRLSLNMLCDRLGVDTTLPSLSRENAINFLVLLKDSQTKSGKTFTPGAINSYLRNIKTAFNWAVAEKLIAENPFKAISRLLDPMHRQFRYLEEETIDKIRKFLKDKPEWQLDMFNFCLWTGARRGEAFNLTKQNLFVDLIKGEKVAFVLLTGEGQKSRNMPLCAEAVELINRRVNYLEDDIKQFALMDRSKSPTMDRDKMLSRLRQGYLFWEIVDQHSISKAFARARKALGLDYFNVHSLRHSFATYCIMDEIPVTTVKEFLGHSDISTTMIYARTDESVKARDIKRMKVR